MLASSMTAAVHCPITPTNQNVVHSDDPFVHNTTFYRSRQSSILTSMFERLRRPSQRPRFWRRDVVIGSLFLVSDHAMESEGAVWSHDLVKWQQRMDPTFVVQQPSIVVTLNALQTGRVVSGHFEDFDQVSPSERPARIPRKFFRLEPMGVMLAIEACDELAQYSDKPVWLPEPGRPVEVRMPDNFNLTKPEAPLMQDPYSRP